MKRLSCPCCNIKECVIIWATKRPERGHYESDSMAVKIGAGDDNPAADSCCVAGKMVCGISASLFGMVFLSAGQCAIGNGDAFVPDAAITGMEALQMLIGGFVIFMIPQVVGSVIVLLELAAVMLRQAWYI